MKNSINKKIVTALSLAFASAFVSQLNAQISITSFSIDGGGGAASSFNHELEATIGQHDAGPEMIGGSFSMTGGFPPTQRDTILLGDVNGDGLVSLLDVAPFVNAITSGEFIPEADVNQDDSVNLLDVEPFVALLAGA